MARHEGKVAVCAGSATGMGADTALRLGREGAKVVIGDVNLAGAEAVADKIRAEGGEALAVEFDIVEASVSFTLLRDAVTASRCSVTCARRTLCSVTVTE